MPEGAAEGPRRSAAATTVMPPVRKPAASGASKARNEPGLAASASAQASISWIDRPAASAARLTRRRSDTFGPVRTMRSPAFSRSFRNFVSAGPGRFSLAKTGIAACSAAVPVAPASALPLVSAFQSFGDR